MTQEIDISELIKWQCGDCIYNAHPSTVNPNHQCVVYGEDEAQIANVLQDGGCEHQDDGAGIKSGDEYFERLFAIKKKIEGNSSNSSIVERE